jgi:integrase
MKGHLRERSAGHWAIVIDVADPQTGKRRRKWHSFKGSKRQAQVECARLIASLGQGNYVERSKATVADFVRARVDQWQASGKISARTAQRYRQLIENQIAPHLGAKILQKLKPLDIEEWHNTLRNGGRVRGQGGVAARTIGHAHRVLGKALADAVKNELVTRNVVRAQPAPEVLDGDDMLIVHDLPGLMAKLPGTRLHVLAMVALFTGVRLGEALALRWNRVDLDRKVAQVREALEQTKAHGIRFKQPKSKAGRRDITLPDLLVDALREHHKSVLELRMQVGAGKLPDDALLFANLDGSPLSPNAMSAAWADFAEKIDMPDVTFHALRHTHASQLIDEGVDIVTISKRLGHSKPDITLRVYAHLFKKDDGKAAAAINAAFGR